MIERIRKAILAYLFPKREVITPVQFPSKTGQSVLTCTPLLAIYGSLFCVDNYNILFKDDDGQMKVLRPVKELPRSKGADFDAYNVDDGFAIRFQDKDYFYMAKFDILPVYNAFMVKLRDIRQPVLNVDLDGDNINVCEGN